MEQFRQASAYICLSEADQGALVNEIAPLVFMEDTDEPAKCFENLIYGLMLGQIEALPAYQIAKRQPCSLMNELEKKITIPQIKAGCP